MATWPAGIRLVSHELIDNVPEYSSQADNLRVFVSTIPGHRFDYTAVTGRLNQDDARRFWAFLISLRGSYHSFDLVIPRRSTVNNAATGTAAAHATAAGAYAVGVTASVSGRPAWLRAGGFIRFAGHAKCYCLIADVDIDAAGAGLLQLNTPLQADVSAAESVIFRDVPFSFRKKPGADPQKFGEEGLSPVQFSVDLIEAI